jgi:hypothetical protein
MATIRDIGHALQAGHKHALRAYDPQSVKWRQRSKVWLWVIASVLGGLTSVVLFLGYYWDYEPPMFDVTKAATQLTGVGPDKLVPGAVCAATLITVTSTLLDKRGGYLSNDILPPGIFMDNIPNWENGVMVQARDFVRALRNDFARSQSQSKEDPDIAAADPRLNFDRASWLFTESEYSAGIDSLKSYLSRLQSNKDAHFFGRADNLRPWLGLASQRLGDLAQQLSASIGNLVIANAPVQSTSGVSSLEQRTPWMKLDDVFYNTRGATWAFLHFFRAVEVDFRPILENKNALISLRQVIRALEYTQAPFTSPVVLSGSEFGLLPNHSLIMASYISRANAAIMDLLNLLAQG